MFAAALSVQHAMATVGRQHPPPRQHPGHPIGIDGRRHEGEALAVRRNEHTIADATVILAACRTFLASAQEVLLAIVFWSFSDWF